MYLSFLFGFVWRLNYKIRGTPKSTKKRGADFPTFYICFFSAPQKKLEPTKIKLEFITLVQTVDKVVRKGYFFHLFQVKVF